MEQSQVSDLNLDPLKVTDSSSDVVVNGTSNIPSSMASDSVFSYFWNAGFLIKIVMLSLLIASIWSWTIIISKYLKLKKLSVDAEYFEESFWSGTPLEKLYNELKSAVYDPMSNVFCAAMAEWTNFAGKYKNSDSGASKILEKRVGRAMQIAMRKEIEELEKGMAFLSSLGTNGVIIGLFGTVVGILNGFKVIALQQSASLAAVAPVISEALFTTAMGIIAAIPAALAYNKLSDSINKYVNRMETFSEEFEAIISRQFDEE